jgi:hypothetical protein
MQCQVLYVCMCVTLPFCYCRSPLLPVGLQGSNGTGEEELEEDDRFPVFHMFILAIAVLSSAIALTSLFPYIGFMIMDVGVASSLDEAGYYSGAIGMCSLYVHPCMLYCRAFHVIFDCFVFSIVFSERYDVWTICIIVYVGSLR